MVFLISTGIVIVGIFQPSCSRIFPKKNFVSEEFYPWVQDKDDSLLFAHFTDETIESIYGLWLSNQKIPDAYKYGCRSTKGIRSIKKQVTAHIGLIGIIDSNTLYRHPSGDSVDLQVDKADFAIFNFHFASRSAKTYWEFVSHGEFEPSYSVVVIFFDDELFQSGKHSWEEVEIYFRYKEIFIESKFRDYLIVPFEEGVLME